MVVVGNEFLGICMVEVIMKVFMILVDRVIMI